MAPPLSKQVVGAIETAIECAWETSKPVDLKNIAQIFNTTPTTIIRIRKRLEKIRDTGIDERGKKQGPKFRYGEKQDEIREWLTGLCQDHPEMKQAEITRLMEEKWGIKYGQSTVCRLIRAWKIPHRVSNRMYENSKLYVEKESVGMINMEGRDKGELVDTLGIGAVRKRALGRADDDQIVENEVSPSQEESDWFGPERLQGLQSLGIAAIQEQERVNLIMSNETWSNPNAVRVPSQFDLPPMLGQHRLVDNFNELLDASNQATEPSTQNQMTYQSSQPGWKY